MTRPKRNMLEPLEEDEPSLIEALVSTALLPYRTLVSNTAKRTYIRTILLALTAFALACIAGLAYVSFYYAYIPQLGFTQPIYLQFEPSLQTHSGPLAHPHGTASIPRNALVVNQGYDVHVHAHMPRAPVNLEAGNFMLDASLLGKGGNQVARSARPAILKYQSPLVESVGRAAALGLHVAGLKTESEWMRVRVFEGVVFGKGTGVPEAVRLELKSEARLWVYEVKVEFRARFKGLRWLMYNFPAFSFVVISTLFWMVEMSTTLVIWAVCSYAFTSAAGPAGQQLAGKKQSELETSDGLSDTSRQFPTSSKQPPLVYSSPATKDEEEEDVKVKVEDDGAGVRAEATVEADDEDDEDADFVVDDLPPTAPRAGFSDSGLGTSYESSAAADLMRRRKR